MLFDSINSIGHEFIADYIIDKGINQESIESIFNNYK